jgi:epoxide hydrolase-like predicted phosphatase
MITGVLFDYGGVLAVGGAKGAVRRMLAAGLGIQPEALRDLGQSYYLLMRGEMTNEAFLQNLYQLHPDAKRPTVDDLMRVADIFQPAPEVYDVARRLREHGLRTGILSNMFAFVARRLREKGMFEGFDPVLISSDVHYMKPDPAFFALGIKAWGVSPAHILYVDDREEMVAAAERMGMQGLLAVEPAQIVRDIRQAVLQQNKVGL